MFFATARDIIDDVAKTICTSNRYALICGGGYSYRSTRYLDASAATVGDIDLLLVVDDMGALAELFTDATCDAMGFAPPPGVETLLIDQQLFREGQIAIVRVSGYIRSYKVGINVTTFDVLRNFCCTEETVSTNKVAHSRTYSVIVAAGTDRSSLIVAKISPIVSRLYPCGTHHLILDKNWYKRADVLHAGTYTDFVATGTVLLDTPDGRAASIQSELLRLMVRNASDETVASGAWDEMFANAAWFSTEFRNDIRARCDALIERGLHTPRAFPVPSTVSRSLVTVFAEAKKSKYYLSAGVARKYNPETSPRESRNARDYLRTLAATREGQLRFINAEVFRLSDIVFNAYGREMATVPAHMTLDNQLYADEKLFYRFEDYKVGSAPVAILSAAVEDMEQLKSEGEDSVVVLMHRLTELRVDVALFLAQSTGSESTLFEQVDTDKINAIVRSRSGIEQ